jgi:hypothetical protein
MSGGAFAPDIRALSKKKKKIEEKLSGVDIMITIFCDFSQFSRKNCRFIKNQWYDQLFSKFGFVLRQKRQFFR